MTSESRQIIFATPESPRLIFSWYPHVVPSLFRANRNPSLSSVVGACSAPAATPHHDGERFPRGKGNRLVKAAPSGKVKTKQPWDQRDWPTEGSSDLGLLFQAIGEAITTWEVLEGHLSLIFTYFIEAKNENASRRAFGIIRTFEGRNAILKEVAAVFFDTYSNDALQREFNKLQGEITSFAGRRNEIAHGVVGLWRPKSSASLDYMVNQTWCLMPSYADSR